MWTPPKSTVLESTTPCGDRRSQQHSQRRDLEGLGHREGAQRAVFLASWAPRLVTTVKVTTRQHHGAGPKQHTPKNICCHSPQPNPTCPLGLLRSPYTGVWPRCHSERDPACKGTRPHGGLLITGLHVAGKTPPSQAWVSTLEPVAIGHLRNRWPSWSGPGSLSTFWPGGFHAVETEAGACPFPLTAALGTGRSCVGTLERSEAPGGVVSLSQNSQIPPNLGQNQDHFSEPRTSRSALRRQSSSRSNGPGTEHRDPPHLPRGLRPCSDELPTWSNPLEISTVQETKGKKAGESVCPQPCFVTGRVSQTLIPVCQNEQNES